MKIFCIGTWKTGTTSMGSALKYLMEDSYIGWTGKTRLLYYNNKYDDIFKISDRINLFDDTPWNCIDIFPKLKDMYPNSKFVLTIREEESWYKSMSRWYKGNINKTKNPKIIKEIYKRQLEPFGYDINSMYIFNDKSKSKWIGWYNKRNEYIVNLFKNTNRLLVYDISEDLGWDPLCNFLKKDIPNINFPHKNKNKK